LSSDPVMQMRQEAAHKFKQSNKPVIVLITPKLPAGLVHLFSEKKPEEHASPNQMPECDD